MSETRGAWPFAGDGPTARARRVAHAYRAELLEADPDRCDDVDARMRIYGQHWAVPRVITSQPGQWLSAADAADYVAVAIGTVRQWRRRGLIEGRRIDGLWHYKTDDLVSLSAELRRRRANRDDDQ